MHSELSHDGWARLVDYSRLLQAATLDVIAITDHNEIAFAKQLQAQWGERVIVGEEVSSNEGDIIGLFLKKLVPSRRPLREIIADIKSQGGLVYVPHPFDTRRHGLGKGVLEQILPEIDIIETFNARNITPGGNSKAQQFARQHSLVAAYGSDAHWLRELGTTYNLLNAIPTPVSLPELLKTAELVGQRVSLPNFFSPAVNKLAKKLFTAK